MRLTALAAASLLASACDASPLHPFTSEVVKRQEPGPGSYYPITGATGGVHPRLEIRELEKTGQMWNLFLLAMKGFQETDQSDIDSWYSVAGIHGMPW
jgi:tyrosinase